MLYYWTTLYSFACIARHKAAPRVAAVAACGIGRRLRIAAAMKMNQFLTKAFRRKVMGTSGGTTLARKLGVIDITTLGVGSTLGAG